MPVEESAPATRMVRHSPMTTPKMIEGESPTLIAYTTSYGLYAVKVTHYDAYDDESIPHWSTACSSGFTIERSEIIWWAYAIEVLGFVESNTCMSLPNAVSDNYPR